MIKYKSDNDGKTYDLHKKDDKTYVVLIDGKPVGGVTLVGDSPYWVNADESLSKTEITNPADKKYFLKLFGLISDDSSSERKLNLDGINPFNVEIWKLYNVDTYEELSALMTHEHYDKASKEAIKQVANLPVYEAGNMSGAFKQARADRNIFFAWSDGVYGTFLKDEFDKIKSR